MKIIHVYAGAIGLVSVAACVFGANPAYDDASDPTYATNSWPIQLQTGYNGGSGFAPWTVSPSNNVSNAGFFLTTCTQNGGGSGAGGGIDATSAYATNVSWGFYAQTNADGFGIAAAYRGFTGGSLGVGQVFSIGFDNGYLEQGYGSAMGLVLRNGNSTTNKNDGQRFELFIFGGDCCYRIATNSADPAIDTGIGWTPDGLHVRFTLTGPDTFSCTITQLVGGASTNITGTLGGTPGSGIDSVALYDQWVGPGPYDDCFFNRMAVGDFGIKSVQLLGGANVALSFGTSTASVYTLEINTNLVSGAWSTVASNIVGTGGTLPATNASSPDASTRFYRVRLVLP